MSKIRFSKRVCKTCRNRYAVEQNLLEWEWNAAVWPYYNIKQENDDQKWASGVVDCPREVCMTIIFSIENLPKDCPYVLEHLIDQDNVD